MNIERAIEEGKKAHARNQAARRRNEAKKSMAAHRAFLGHVKNAERWVKKYLAGKVKYRASLGDNSMSLDDDGIKGTKISFIPAKAKYHVILNDLKLRKTLRAYYRQDEYRPADDCGLEKIDVYWIEWGKEDGGIFY